MLRFRAILFLFLCLLMGCGAKDQPLDLTPDLPAPGGSGGGTTPPGPGSGACVVNFQANLQLKASANPPSAGGPFEILDANPFPISAPIPIEVNGNQLTLKADSFPTIYFRPPETAADLRITGTPGTQASGSYDPATGEMSFDGFHFSLEIVQKGGTDNFLPGVVELPLANFTTGSVTATGNLHPITETGKPVDKNDRTLVLVTGFTLQTDFSPLNPLDSILGGGALTGRFEGVLDQLPENCSPDGGGEFPPGEAQPKDLTVAIENQAFISKIDFGDALVIPRKVNGRTILDCSDTLFRGVIAKIVTIKNASTKAKTLFLGQPQDTDEDIRSPLCGGFGEFIRGSVSLTGGATCKTVTVGGKKFNSGECTLPPNDAHASIAFPLLYAPYDFQETPSGGEAPVDSGVFLISDGENPDFPIQLAGRTLADFRDVFSVSKVTATGISPKEIRNRGLLKIPLDMAEPFTQKLVLQNAGTDTWNQVNFSLAKGSNFSVKTNGTGGLPSSDGTIPGRMEFEVTFNPGAGMRFDDTLIVQINRAGSSAKIEIQLLGTVGVAPLKGRMALHFDFFTALVDHVALSEPIESNDFRVMPEWAPSPLLIDFADTEDETLKSFTIESPPVNLLDPNMTVEQRKKILRVFTARASIGKDGSRLDPGDNADQCNEPLNINQPYQAGDCSYFYWTDLRSQTGTYDDESGHLIMPEVQLQLQNPYHADIFGIWPASNPSTNPDYRLNTPLTITFTTHTLDNRVFQEEGPEVPLVADERISNQDLVVREKRLGPDCPEGFLVDQFPHLKCYLSADGRYLEGRVVTLRPGKTDEYDIILVGVGQFQPGTTDPDIPWFMGDFGGSRIYIAIQGRLIAVPQIPTPRLP